MRTTSALSHIGHYAKEALGAEIKRDLHQIGRNEQQISRAASFALTKLENEQRRSGTPPYLPPPTTSLLAVENHISSPLRSANVVRSLNPSATGMAVGRTFWTSSSQAPIPPAVATRTLEHKPLDDMDRRNLRSKLGGDNFDKVNQFRHRDGMCHTDTTLMALQLAGKAPSRIGSGLSALVNHADGTQTLRMVLGATSNAWLPWTEFGAGNTHIQDVDQLMTFGMPENSAAVVLHATSGLLDPRSAQADAIEPYLSSGDGDMIRLAGNHSALLLDVDVFDADPTVGFVYLADFDPHRPAGTEALFKIDKQVFMNKFVPRNIIGVMNVPKAPEAQ